MVKFEKSLDGNLLYIDGDIDFSRNIVKIDKKGNRLSTINFDRKYKVLTYLETNNGLLVGGVKSDGFAFILFIKNEKIVWEKTYYGNSASGISGIIKSIESIPEGGYLLTGEIFSRNEQQRDICVIKIDEQGNQIWEKKYGGELEERGLNVIKQGNGYIICGNSYSPKSGNKSTENNGYSDIWIFKIDSNGNKIWENNLGGDDNDEFKSILLDDESIYILGTSGSGISGDKSEKSLSLDYWFIKLNSNGDKIWDKTIGGVGLDLPQGVIKLSNDEFLTYGNSNSTLSGNKSQNPYDKTYFDYWFVNVNSKGNILWDKVIGGKYDDNSVGVVFDKVNSEVTVGGVSDSPISFDKTSGPVQKEGKKFWISNIKYEIKD